LKVALTGTRAEPLAGLLRAQGLDVLHVPLIRIEPFEGPPVRVVDYDWLVLTSRNAVDCLFARLEGGLPRVAAIGPATAEALRERGVEAALVAGESTQEGLVADFPHPPGRVLFAGAEDARAVIADELAADVLPLYRTVELRPEAFPDADLVVLASPSAARSLVKVRRDARCVAIGSVTAAEARRLGLVIAAEAQSPAAEDVARAVKLAASRSVSSRS
jgi:uroporphyrinogen III methyltransferase / synthase